MSAICYIYKVTFMSFWNQSPVLHCLYQQGYKVFLQNYGGTHKYVSDCTTYSNEQLWPSDLFNQSTKVSEWVICTPCLRLCHVKITSVPCHVFQMILPLSFIFQIHTFSLRTHSFTFFGRSIMFQLSEPIFENYL